MKDYNKNVITEAFPKLENSAFIRLLRTYFRSVWHIIVVVLLTTLSALFGLEIPVYYCFALIALAICFFGDDTLGVLPVVCCAPMTIAIKHSPKHHPGVFFGDPSVTVQIFFCVALILIAFIARLISSFIRDPKRKLPRFTVGFAFLFIAYVIGGAFSAYYSKTTVLFGLMEIASISVAYFLFHLTVNWKKMPKGYFAYLFTAMSFGLVIQILSMYFQKGIVVNGEIERGRLFLGWAHYNYAGAVTAMCVPAIFYFSFTQKHSWIFTMLATVVMLGVVLTQSRGSILFGGIIYLACAVITLVKNKKRERIFNFILLGAVLVAAIIVSVVCIDGLKKIFAAIFRVGTDSNGRLEGEFIEAWGYFCRYPLFGVGWGGDNWKDGYAFFKYFKAHNTVLQLLGSLGLFGLVAYGFHRVQTCIALFRHPTVEKMSIALTVSVLLLTCMMDVHIFSFGPAILYSVLLAFLEGENIRGGVDTRLKLKRLKMKKKENSAT